MSERGCPSTTRDTDQMRGKTLLCIDGPLGNVHDVIIDPETAKPTHLVWREGVMLTREITIPIEYVAQIDDEHILLKADREKLHQLPQVWW